MASAALAAAGRANRLQQGGPWLFYVGQSDDCPTAAGMVANQSLIQSRAAQFDGCGVIIPSVWTRCMAPANVSEATILGELTGWAAADFGDHDKNWAVLLWCGEDYGPGGSALAAIDWTNNTHWATIAANWGHLASALKTVGKFSGIWFDNEAYCVTWNQNTYPYNWGGDSNGPTTTAATGLGILPSHTRSAAFSLVYQRGVEIMNAVLDAWPECQVMQSHPTFAGDYYMGEQVAGFMPWVNVWFGSELKAPFTYGMMSRVVARKQGIVWDGGEMYGLRGIDEQWRAHHFRAFEAPRVASQFTYTDSLANYRLGISQAVYDKDEFDGFALQSESAITEQIAHMLLQNGSYCWFYSEIHDWYGAATASTKTAVPTSYLDAVWEGRRMGRGMVPLPPPPPADEITWSDDFTSSANLTAVQGSISIASGKLRAGSASADTMVMETTAAIETDQYVEATVSTLSGSFYTGVFLRYTDAATDTFYRATINDSGAIQIYYYDGSWNFLNGASVTVGAMPAVMRGQVVGDTIRFYWRGVLVCSATNSALASGKSGVYMNAGTPSTCELDSVVGGPL